MKLLEDAQYRNLKIHFAKLITEKLQEKLGKLISKNEMFYLNEYPNKAQYLEVENTNIFQKTEEYWLLSIQLNDEYPEIIFEFVLNPNKVNSKSKITFAYNKKSQHIIMPVLSYNDFDELCIELGDLYILSISKRLENILVHEITHWVDFMRTEGKIRFNTEDDLKNYYNCDAELNSFTNEILSYIEQEGRKIKSNKSVREIVNEVIRSYNFNNRFGELLNYLTVKNKKKLIKRIYDYFDKFGNLLECIQERFDLYEYNKYFYILYENYYEKNNMKELYESIHKEKERIENGKFF